MEDRRERADIQKVTEEGEGGYRKSKSGRRESRDGESTKRRMEERDSRD